MMVEAALSFLLVTTQIAGSPISHVIVVIQENRTFDNLFNGFPGANTVTSGRAHDGRTVPLQPHGLEWPFDPSHSHASLVTEYNGGAMSGFDLDACDANGENFLAHHTTACTGPNAPPPDFTYSYVPRSQTQLLWYLAGAYAGYGYGIADAMFASRQVPSFPAHQFLIAGLGPANDPIGAGDFLHAIWGCDAPPGAQAGTFGATYDAPLVLLPPCYDYATLGDLLDARHVSWTYYTGAIGYVDGQLAAYDAVCHVRYAARQGTCLERRHAGLHAGRDWSRASTPMLQIFNDIDRGTLPAVSFVTPPAAASDHAGFLSAAGPTWVAAIFEHVARSAALYAHTAILVTWDDSGGWYDHVPPPNDAFGPLGFRVPLLVISPYAIRAVNHDQHDFGSILHFIERNWGLGTLGERDAHADDLGDMLDYHQPQLSPEGLLQLPSFIAVSRACPTPYSPRTCVFAKPPFTLFNRPVDDDR